MTLPDLIELEKEIVINIALKVLFVYTIWKPNGEQFKDLTKVQCLPGCGKSFPVLSGVFNVILNSSYHNRLLACSSYLLA